MTLNVGASVVSYRPDPAHLLRLREVLRDYLDCVILVDNGGGSAALRSLGAQPDVVFASNRGMAVAMNAALEAASGRDIDWIVHFDQDSLLESDLGSFARRLAEAPDDAGIVAGQYTDRHSGRQGYSQLRIDRVPFTPIAAGSAFRLAAWRSVGGFDEQFPVDLFDFAYALRLQQAGWRVIVDPLFSIDHSVGRRKTHSCCAMDFVDPGHPPWRTYVKLDATARIARTYGRRFPKWVFRHILARLVEMFSVLVVSADRWAHWVVILRWLSRRKPPELIEIVGSDERP